MKTKLLFPLALLLIGCGNVPSSSETSTSSSESFSLEEGEVFAYVREGKAHITWNCPDHSLFRVFGSDSKYGTYQLLTEKNGITGSSFSTPSYRYGYFKVAAYEDGKDIFLGKVVSPLGDNALVIEENDDLAKVQEEIDERHSHLETADEGQFSSERFAALFLPGHYENIEMKLGYYSSALGLGMIPDDTEVGGLYVSTNVLGNNNSTCTFWRNAMNLSFPDFTQFAVSQATSLRRCHFKTNLALAHTSGWSSGGFLADSKVDIRIESRTQQQWLSRNDEFGKWNGNSHNYVFSGCVGQMPAHSWSESTSRTSILEKTTKMAEAPFLYVDNGEYKVFIPSLHKESQGLSWNESSMGKGRSESLDSFYVALPSIDDSSSLNDALSQGKSILFTPGIYHLDTPLHVKKENSVLMGIGYPTLQVKDNNDQGAILIDDVDGVRVSSILLDAGAYSSYLLKAGKEKTDTRHTDNPLVLSDLFCRIGGKENVHTEVNDSVIVFSNDTIGDNLWLWRADHSRGVAWNDSEGEEGRKTYGNPAYTGLRVLGDYVSMYGLMVEHFEEYQTYWAGEYGETIMYQSETPYRVPSQDEWYNTDLEKDGYASYKIADSVDHHFALGIGIYWVHYTHDFLESAIEAPIKEGIDLEHLVTVTFSGNSTGGIRHVVNDFGDAVGEDGEFRALVESYPLKEGL